MDNEMIVEGWQPIETAPKKDGFLAIVYCPDNHPEERIMMGQYQRGSIWAAAGWRIHIDEQRLDPAYWHPLPEPPRAILSDEPRPD